MKLGKTEKRIEQYLAFLKRRSHRRILPSPCGSWEYACTSKTFGEHVPDLDYKAMTFPFAYGKGWTNWWFRAEVDLTDLTGDLFLELLPETDAMVFVDGKPEGAVNPFHPLFRVTPFLGRMRTIHIEAWDGHRFPGFHPGEGGRVQTTVAVPKKDYPLVFPEPRLLVRNQEVHDLYFDVLALYRMSRTLEPEGFWYRTVTSTLHDALMTLDIETEDESIPSDGIARVRASIAPLLDAHNGTHVPQVLSVGNAHLDHAWLWPIGETVRKAARTCLNMTAFSRIDPSFRFLFSQPAQMEAVREVYPSVFAKVKDAYDRGSWEPNGVMYIEPDCQLPGGESFIRQCLFGRRLVADLFDGYEGDVCWLPDSFGFAPSLPQILRGCGIDYFVTSKLSWNDTNRFPYDVFQWEGLDGTRIPCHMIQGAYEGTNDPVDVAQAYASVVHKELQPTLLRSVGEGDGGGGTTESDLAFMRREADLQGMPRNRWCGLSEAMHAIFDGKTDLPVYRGELYLELHRGTYTGQARLKRYNRRLEALLHAAEYLDAIRFCLGKNRKEDKTALEQVWKTVLTNQFHDILPGSAIRKVNEEAEASYMGAYDLVRSVLAEPQGPWLLNAGPFPFPLPDGSFVPPYACAEVRPVSDPVPCKAGPCRTDWGSVELSASGTIDSLVLDSCGRQVVASEAQLNRLTLCEDVPIAWDAWDIEADSLAKAVWIGAPEHQERTEDDDTYRITQRFSVGRHSILQQEAVIWKHRSRIDFHTTVSWHERHRLLRVEFPTSLQTDHVLCDEPFCYAERSTRCNDSLERARFEIPAHKWIALCDAGLCVAVATDCKYGYAARGGNLSISLLRSSTAPDPEADQGEQVFSYALLLSEDGLGPVMADAEALNTELLPVERQYGPLATVVGSSIVIETVKVAEDGTGIVIRLREPYGMAQTAILSFSPLLDGRQVRRTDLLERPVDDADPYSFHPFEVKTLVVPCTRWERT